MFTSQNGVKILGCRGMSNKTVESSVYTTSMFEDFVVDAFNLGYQTRCNEKLGVCQAFGVTQMIEGEWSPRDGGMLSWSV